MAQKHVDFGSSRLDEAEVGKRFDLGSNAYVEVNNKGKNNARK